MDKPEIGPIAAPLAQRLGPGASAGQVAQAVAALWQELDQALRPIIGAGGVQALLQRSLHLAAMQHPWLRACLGAPLLADVDTAALAALLARQDAAQALACGTLLFLSVHRLLTSLIGASLTARLLHPVWGTPPSRATAQDMPP